MNRVTVAIERMRKQVADRIASGATTQEAADRCCRDLDMDCAEHAKFQTLKSAVVDVVLTLKEGQTLYCLLGESPDVFNAQPVHIKAVLTQIFAELLGSQLGRA